MKKTDFEKFAVSWLTAHSAYESKPTPEAVAFCFSSLNEFSLSDVQSALVAHARDADSGKFAPKPADIVRQLKGREDARAALAWTDFRKATRSGIMPKDDPVMCRVIERMGGLDRLGDMNSRDLDFMEKQVKALFLAHEEPARLGIANERAKAIAAMAKSLVKT